MHFQKKLCQFFFLMLGAIIQKSRKYKVERPYSWTKCNLFRRSMMKTLGIYIWSMKRLMGNEWKRKKYIFLAQSPLLPQRKRDCPHSVGVSHGANLLILAQLHRRFSPPFLKIWGPHFLIFLLFIQEKKN